MTITTLHGKMTIVGTRMYMTWSDDCRNADVHGDYNISINVFITSCMQSMVRTWKVKKVQYYYDVTEP